jgi:RNA polymerase sigma-70 factor (ECF subfamily)
MPGTPEQLFLRFRTAGDPQALGELFDLTSPQLLSLALHLCGNPADAEDALQATFATAIARAATWDPGRPVQPWLGGILTLQCRKIGDRRVRRREAELPDGELLLDDGSPVAASERRELVGKLREHIDRLPQEQRQVLLLQLEHGLSPAEVAEVLAVPPGTVRMRLHRGVKALRGLMPAGLVALLLGALPSRGLAAVRAAVLQHAAAAAVGGGALLLKKALVAAGVLAVLAVGWVVAVPWIRAAEPDAPVAGAPAASCIERPDAVAAGEAPSSTERSEAPAAASATPAAAPERGSLFVRIVSDPSGRPIPNVPVAVLPRRSDCEGWFELVTAVTGADGTCTVAGLAPGRWDIRAIGGHGAEVRAGQCTTAELEIPDEIAPPVAVRGRVVHHDGRPASGASIVVKQQGGMHSEVVGVADGAGRFEATVVRGFLLLGARLAGFAPSPHQGCREGEAVELVLPGPGAGVAGLVVDGNGAPVHDALVQVGELRRSRQWTDARGVLQEAPPPQRLRTDHEGRFAAADLVADEISVQVRADGFAPFHCYVRTVAGQTIEAHCALSPGVALRGRVVDEAGAPVRGAWVSLGGTSGDERQTDADGRFGYRHVKPGLLQLVVRDDSIANHYCERGAAETGEWNVIVHRLPRFQLRFVDEIGSPLVGWMVRIASGDAGSSVTDEAGRVALHAGGEGPYDLRLSPRGTAQVRPLQALMPWPWPVGIVAGVETEIVVPTAQQPAASIAGVVLDPDGTPLTLASIAVCSADGNHAYRQRQSDGRFRFERVPAGDWVVEVHRAGSGSAGGRFPVKALQHGEARDLGELRLPREGLLQVRVVLADGSVPRDASVFLWDAAGHEHNAPPRDGQQHRWPVGRYTWKVMEDDSLWESGACEVRDGEVASIEVVLRPAVRRYLQFPVPRPDWGEPKRVDYVLRAPDGGVYDTGDFDPREEMPFRYMPALSLGTWRLELKLDDGRTLAGSFELTSMTPSRESIPIAVAPR